MNQVPRNLSEFTEILRKENDLTVIEAPVDPYLEVAEIHRRVIEEGGRALLFRNVNGSTIPLLTNLFGTAKRIDLAFGSRPERLVEQIAKLPEELLPPSVKSLWKARHTLFDLLRVGVRRRSSGSVQELCQVPPKLDELPLLTTWPHDGGAFITLPLVYTEHPETRQHNLGMYRIQRFDNRTTGLHCQIGKGGGFHLAVAQKLGRRLPVNIAIGGPPALILSAIAPLPENAPELLLASLVLGRKMELCKQPYSELPLFSEAEFVLVGEVDPTEVRPEGPFGDHYGYYSLQHDYPVFRCKALYRKKNAMCAATVVGKPKQEDFFLGDYLQKLLSPLFPVVMPSVQDLWSYGETGYHALASAVVQQRYKREAMMSAFRILGEGQLSLTKFLLVVDREMNLTDFPKVLQYILERADFRSDLYVFSNVSMDTLDYSGPAVNEGSKGVLLGSGDPIRSLPPVYVGACPPHVSAIEVFCPGCLLVQGPTFTMDKDFGEYIAQYGQFSEWPLIVLVDDVAQAKRKFLWTCFTRFEPGADIAARAKLIVRNHLAFDAPVVIDSRMKPWYPDVVEPSSETVALVDSRWTEYFSK